MHGVAGVQTVFVLSSGTFRDPRYRARSAQSSRRAVAPLFARVFATSGSLVATKPQVCVIGLDCAPPELVFDQFRADLPNLNRLMRSGIYGPLESTVPPITVPAWMSMMTGRDPGTLGIYGFRNRKDHSYDGLAFANSRMVHKPKVWDVLAQHSLRSILLGVPLTYPPQPMNGETVACFLTPDTSAEYTWPPQLKVEIEQVVGEYMLDVRNFRTNDRDWLLRQLTQMLDTRFKLARHLVATHPWDYFMMVEMGTDRIHHAFWRFFDTLHPLYEGGNPYEEAIHDYYVQVDSQVGSIVDLLPVGTLVVVVSDHGATRMVGGICFNDWLIRQGYLTLKQAPVGVTKFSPELVDWSRTTAWADGGYYGRLFLNIKGREPQGTLESADVAGVLGKLRDELHAMPDEHGAPLGTCTYLPAEVYAECNNIPPDLIVYFGNLNWRSVGSVGNPSIWVHENDTGPDDANHSRTGMVIISRKGEFPRGDGELRTGLSIYDIAPTLLREFGIEVPAGMGRTAISGTSDDVYTEAEEADIARRLEDLGYL